MWHLLVASRLSPPQYNQAIAIEQAVSIRHKSYTIKCLHSRHLQGENKSFQ